jgi:pyruvate carboxylase
MSRIADVYAHCHSDFVSLELWGGATFDTAMRFLRESPWDRLDRLRHAIPNIPFQMLLRASNALGYSSYPDNVVHEFVRLAAESGIDIFRIFDSLNDTRNMQIAIEAVVRNGGLAEAAICYTGDILDPDRSKYALDYYLEMSRDLERMGAHILAIKDMAGLCKPYAAYQLIRALKNEVGLPIHFHTHDTSGGQMATLLKAVEAGADIVDGAMAPLAGLTSQPSLNTFVEMLRFSPRNPGFDTARLEETAHYWEVVRQYYCAFESTLRTGTADVYKHQMPGGQYTNLYQQAAALGLEENWPEVWQTYARVNELFGDIVKVTPSSKVVGDLALFMLTNDLSPQDLTGSSKKIDFPESVIDFFQGRLGTPKGGFPARLRERILGDLRPIQGRPGESLPPADLPGVRKDLEGRLRRKFDERDTISYLLYPQVFQEFIGHQTRFGDVSVLPTPVFFYGMEREAEVLVELEPGKTLIIKLMAVGEPDTRGNCTVFFELNGVPREVQVPNRSVIPQVSKRAKADPGDPLHVGAPMPGMVISVSVSSGAKVAQGEKLLTLQAMKMELTLYADREAEIEELLVEPGDRVNTKDLLLTYCRELIEAG